MSTPAFVYPYASGDLLEQRNTYFYSAYAGTAFLSAWRAQRSNLLTVSRHADADTGGTEPDTSATAHLLDALWSRLQDGSDADALATLAHLLQRFEVSKRVHGAYGVDWRPLNANDYRNPSRYLRLAELFERAWTHTEQLPWLNGLLKLLDTLSCLRARLNAAERERLRELAAREARHVAALQTRLENAARGA